MSKIKLITGAMGSGKSAELLKEILNFDNENDFICFVPEIDTREKGVIKSRNGMQYKAVEVKNFDEMFNTVMLNPDVKHIFIDEVQFIDVEGIRDLYIYCKKFDINITLAGLDLTSELVAFETTAIVSCFADEIMKVAEKCRCGGKTRLTEYKKGEKTKEVEIGGDELYEGVCENCHNIIASYQPF